MKLKITLLALLLACCSLVYPQDTTGVATDSPEATTSDTTLVIGDSSVLDQDTAITGDPIDTAGFEIPGTGITLDTAFVDSVCLSVRDVVKLVGQKPDSGQGPMALIWWIIGGATLLLDIVLRFIPSAKNNTIVGIIDNILDAVVKLANGLGNAAKTETGEKAAFKTKATPVGKA